MSKELRSILVQLLSELDEICRKNDIKYYLLGGTCIGQIRHGGFVPWDDDIDITMPRSEYEKLEAVIDQYMPEGRELVSVGRFDTYTSPIPRYMDLNTTALRSGRVGDGTVCGECIEIFILDPVPREEPYKSHWKKLLYAYCEMLCTGWVQAKRRLCKNDVDVSLYEEYRKKMDKIGRSAVLREMEEELFSVSEEEADTYCLRWMPRGLYEFPIHCFGTPKDVQYEGLTVYSAQRAKEMLQIYLGYTWRNLLPPEARDIHPTLINHDLASGNCEREYLQLRDTKKIAEDIQKFKDLAMEYYRLRDESYIDRLGPAMKYAEAKTNQNVNTYGVDALKKDNNLAVKAMQEYAGLQRSSIYRTNDVAIPIKSEYLDVLAKAMFEKAMIQQLFEILHVRHHNEKKGLKMSEIQKTYYRACKDFLKMSVEMDEEEYENAEQIYEKYVSIYPDHNWLYRTKLCLECIRAKDKKDFERIKKYAEEALEVYPKDDMLNKRYADVLTELGDSKRAETIYIETAKRTINGLLLREMKEQGIKEAALKLDAIVWEFE